MKNVLISIGFLSTLIAAGIILGIFAPWAFGYILTVWITVLVLGFASEMFYYEDLAKFGVWVAIILIAMRITKYVA